MLQTAGATVTGTVTVHGQVHSTRPATTELLDLADSRAAAERRGRRLPRTATAWRPPARCWPRCCCRAARHGRRPTATGTAVLSRRTRARGYHRASTATVDRRRPRRSWSSPAPPVTDKDAEERNAAVLTIVDQFDAGRAAGGRRQRPVRRRQPGRRGPRRPDAGQERLHSGQRRHPAGPGRHRAGLAEQLAGTGPATTASAAAPTSLLPEAAAVSRRRLWRCGGQLAGRAGALGRRRAPRCAALRRSPVRAPAAGADQLPGPPGHPRRRAGAGRRRRRSARRRAPASGRRGGRRASTAGLGSGAVGLYDDLVGGRPEQQAQGLPRAPRRAARGPGHQRRWSRSPGSARPAWPPPRCCRPRPAGAVRRGARRRAAGRRA